jgi:hypothetical protein
VTQVALQQVRGGKGIRGRLGAGPGGALGHSGGQSLVVGVHGNINDRGELIPEGSRLGCLRSLRPAQRDGQPYYDQIRIVLGHQLRDLLRIRRLDHSERTRDGTSGVRNRTTRAGFPVIDREDAHRPPGSGAERALDRLARGRQSVVQPFGIAAAGLRDVVAPAATAAHDLGRTADDLRGGQPPLDGTAGEAGH